MIAMAGFNHYARLRDILSSEPPGWFIRCIDQPTRAQNFRGEVCEFDHYYRLYHADGTPIRYGKFQQLDRLAAILQCDSSDLPCVDR